MDENVGQIDMCQYRLEFNPAIFVKTPEKDIANHYQQYVKKSQSIIQLWNQKKTYFYGSSDFVVR